MTDWLLDTLLWTGVLIGLVLVLRRPVARHFGAGAAYALWLLPALRLMMPGLTLPAWMNPSPEETVTVSTQETMFVLTAEGAEPVIPAVAEPAANMPIDWLALALAAWLTGAIVFLVARFKAYFGMRRELLEDAREVGTVDGGLLGDVRLVETPATNAPLAFGVRDRVIALPPRFLAMAERPMRDLALAHELAHHKGGDLFANFAVQPLFALHWFNPLGWVGWRAMRRDQEAACDARVVGTVDAEMRAQYAHTIASFAAGTELSRGVALAAPMACPVLGDKSIIHRLRSLTMSDISNRRRWAGRSLLLAGAMALPLTASISYAESIQEVPVPPSAAEAPEAPAAPAAPDAPQAPEAPETERFAWSSEDGEFEIAFGDDKDGKKIKRRVIVDRDGEGEDGENVFIYKVKDKEGKVRVEERKIRRLYLDRRDANPMTEEEVKKLEKRIEKDMKLREKELKKMEKRFEKMGERIEKQMEMRFGKDFEDKMVRLECEGEEPKSTSFTSEDGGFTFNMCAAGLAAEARKMAAISLKEVRQSIKTERNLSAQEREEALRGIDEAIAELTTDS